MEKSLIEKWFPVRKLSRDAAIEMAYKAVPAYIKHCRELKIPEKNIRRNFYDPKIRNLHPWFARRPCSVARALTLAATLPAAVDDKSFMKAIGWNEKSKAFILEGYPPLLFYTDPDRQLINELSSEHIGKSAHEIVICDPMAGGGTIPLESLRLGFRSIAVEYNPVAYLILKGTIEYPSLYGNKLAEHVREESKKLISYAEDELGRFYPRNSEGYIVARGVKCPHCEGKIPLLHTAQIARSTYLGLKFDSSTKDFRPYITKFPNALPYQGKKRGEIICPYCGAHLTKKQAYKLWTEHHTAILNELRKGIFNKDKILSTHVLLVKQTKKGYVICNQEEDISAFLDACKTLMSSFKDFEEYIPRSEIPLSNEVFAPMKEYGIKYWYELFNPRQLLSLTMLIKYVHERCKFLLSQGRLGAAISLYLVIGISRVIDYNSIATTWKKGTIRDTIGRYAQGRKITYGEAYCEAIIPYRNLNWIFESSFTNKEKTEGGICPIVNELCKSVGNMGKHISVIHGDSRFLSSILSNVPVDVINVDPPYFDQHIYSDISEYFWQIFRIALRPLIEAELLFEKSNLADWKPTSSIVPREGEIIARKSRRKRRKISEESVDVDNIQPFDQDWYTNQMGILFSECFKSLKSDGILLTWFTHRSFEAWKAIISALYAGGFYVTKIWPVTSELLTRLVSKRNNLTLNRTLIICARKRDEKEISESNLRRHAINLMKDMCDVLAKMNATRSELRIFLRAVAMCAVTKASLPKEALNPIQYCQSKLIPWSVKLVEETLPVFFKRFTQRYSSRTLEDFL
jgi:adenine-specific DNA methylase